MFPEIVSLGVALLVVVTVIAIGAYIGTLRALATYFSGQDSVFLGEDERPPNRQSESGDVHANDD